MEKTRVRIYTDYKSPYAFVANKPLFELEEKHGVELEWLPYTLRVAEFMGTVEERTPHFWRKVRYSYMDARRFANAQGLTMKGPRRILNRLDNDDDENVRYGSLRSLIELASRDGKNVSSIVDALCARLIRLRASSRLLNELARAVFLSKDFAPSTWSEQISRLFYDLLDLSDSADEAQRWSGMASKLRVHLRSTPQVAA